MAEGEFAQVKDLLEKALQRLEIAPSYVDPASDHDIYAMLADLAVEERDLATMKRSAPLAESTAESCGHQLYLATAYRARGVAAALDEDYPQAQSYLDQALEIFQGLDARWQMGRTLVQLADVARAQADSTTSREYLSRALEAFESLGARPDAERARAALTPL